MNPRELVILLLGLAIVAVVLRGLYVALQARRGQIRLAIDKNIPKDVDLDALEMAELPSGGARVVRRDGTAESTDQQESELLARANARAAALDLGESDASPVPVLMDAVQLNERTQADELESDQDQFETDPEDSDYDDYDSEPSADLDEEWDDEDWGDEDEEERVARVESDESDEYPDEETVSESAAVETEQPGFFERDFDEADDLPDSERDEKRPDYDSEDMAAVAPDYDEDESQSEEESEFDASGEDGTANHVEHYEDGDYDDSADEDGFEDEEDFEEGYADEDYESDYDDESVEDADHDLLAEEESTQQRTEPSLGSFEEGLDDFSMTAGERIGYENQPSRPAASIRAAENSVETEEAESTADLNSAVEASQSEEKPKRRSLFDVFSRFGKSRDRDEATAVTPDEDELEDVLLQSSPPSPSSRSASNAEPMAQAQQPQFAAIPELDGLDGMDESGAEEIYSDSSDDAQSIELPNPMAQAVVQPIEQAAPQQLDIEPGHSRTTFDQQLDSQSVAEPSEVLVINVMAKEGYVFAGDDLLHTLITSGLKFGDMNIFHQRLGNQSKGPVVFSVANILNPGTFDLNAMDSFTTVGISMFLALPSPINNLDALEKMLGVAQALCDSLGGELRDDTRNMMTAQTIEHYRQRVRDFELRQLKAAGGRG